MYSTKDHLTPHQAANLLMVSPSAIRLWAERGELKSTTTAKGNHRFKLEDIKEFAIEKNIKLNIDDEGKQRILIVDDEPLFAGFLKDALLFDHENLIIDVCFNGFAAGMLINSFEPTIILLDLMMPAIDGFQLCKQIKQDPLLSHIRIIAMSGHTSELIKKKVIDAGAETCLEKPINIEKLLELLNLENATHQALG
jgi:excisionase family DNA binding protein